MTDYEQEVFAEFGDIVKSVCPSAKKKGFSSYLEQKRVHIRHRRNETCHQSRSSDVDILIIVVW